MNNLDSIILFSWSNIRSLRCCCFKNSNSFSHIDFPTGTHYSKVTARLCLFISTNLIGDGNIFKISLMMHQDIGQIISANQWPPLCAARLKRTLHLILRMDLDAPCKASSENTSLPPFNTRKCTYPNIEKTPIQVLITLRRVVTVSTPGVWVVVIVAPSTSSSPALCVSVTSMCNLKIPH